MEKILLVEDEFSIITGLDLGADDYISKPFQPRILLSRIQNILRRYKKQDQIFQYQNLQVYISQAKVFKNHQEIFLSALEYKLLLIFVQHAHHLLTREFLLEELYQMTGEDMNDNTLTVYIKRLRNKGIGLSTGRLDHVYHYILIMLYYS